MEKKKKNKTKTLWPLKSFQLSELSKSCHLSCFSSLSSMAMRRFYLSLSQFPMWPRNTGPSTGALLLFLVIYIALSAPSLAACHSSWIALSFLEFQITRNMRASFYKLCEICLRAVETHDRLGSVLLPPSLRCPQLWRQALTRDYITSSSPVSSSTKDSNSPLDKILNKNFTLY